MRKPKESKLGIQPAYKVIREQRRSVQGIARAIDVNPKHLQRAVLGWIHPSPLVRKRLPAFLGVSLDELFTPEVLAGPMIPMGGYVVMMEQAEKE